MESIKNIILSKKFIWVFTILNICTVVAFLYSLNDNGIDRRAILAFSMPISYMVSAWILYDIATQNIYGKMHWIMSIIMMSLLAAPLYLLQRPKLIRMANSKFSIRR